MDDENENWSDDENPKNESDDLLLLLFCAFIYQKRTRPGNPQVDKKLAELSEWLTQNGKLRVDVESCAASTLDFDLPDTAKVVDALKTYRPEFPLVFLFSDNSGSYMARRIDVRSPSLYTYRLRSGTLDLPLLHGGKVQVDGDVSFESVVDLLNSQKELALTTEIDVSGSLVGCSPESVGLAMNHLRRIVGSTPDDELFLFSICGSVRFEEPTDADFDPILVRKWTISFSSSGSSRWCLKCSMSP